jgi:hypothetical protein
VASTSTAAIRAAAVDADPLFFDSTLNAELVAALLTCHATEVTALASHDSEFFHVGMMRKLGYRNREWRDRLFALSRRDLTLYYFRTRTDFEQRRPAGEIFLKVR